MKSWRKEIKRWHNAFWSLLYPDLCTACGAMLYQQEKVLCTKCEYELPRTHFHQKPGNVLEQNFWGRVPVENAAAYFFYKKASPYQQLLYQLKYHGRQDIGEYLGELLGVQLAGVKAYQQLDMIVPVPLHPRKLQKRGYNQSEAIARGLAKQLQLPIEKGCLLRKVYTDTQTRKHRYERFQNIKDVFTVAEAHRLQDKHVLLVDDVITTGSTLEGCILVLHEAARVKVSVASLAYAENG